MVELDAKVCEDASHDNRADEGDGPDDVEGQAWVDLWSAAHFGC
jgi:hypothetical protein